MNRITPHSFQYPRFDIYWDYLKTIVGLTIGSGGLIFGLDNTFSRLSFSAIIIVFVFFGLQSIRRHKTVVTLSEKGLIITAFRTEHMAWKDINNIELRYYGRPVKDKDPDHKPKGTLNLKLTSKRQKINLDSKLYGFKYLVWCATLVASEYKAPLDPSTVGNMLDIGLDPKGGSEMPDTAVAGF